MRDKVAEQLLEFIDSNGGKIHNSGGGVQAFYKEYPGAKAVVQSLNQFCSEYPAIGFRPDGNGSGSGWLYRVGA